MSISRKRALKRMRALRARVIQHLDEHNPDLIEESPESIPHWREEIAAWLEQIQTLAGHVGKSTAMKWNGQLEELRAQANALFGNED